MVLQVLLPTPVALNLKRLTNDVSQRYNVLYQGTYEHLALQTGSSGHKQANTDADADDVSSICMKVSVKGRWTIFQDFFPIHHCQSPICFSVSAHFPLLVTDRWCVEVTIKLCFCVLFEFEVQEEGLSLVAKFGQLEIDLLVSG
ncbi:unnamed protein product [Orchesella dallaii]|uniref:Uncharacterized protein n=1 Tax=Orchesella dallaii TaxID=48710 RepID=A0ABP1Q8X7_9HEXA